MTSNRQRYLFTITFLVSPFLLTFLPIPLPPFSPRQLIYENNIWPLLFAPWSPIHSPGALLSRLIQATILHGLPSNWYLLWIILASLRCGIGHLLTRVVGWTSPFYFSHTSLYETIGGMGPIFAFVVVSNGWIESPSLPLPEHQTKSFIQQTFSKVPLNVFAVLLCALDNAPWTYSIAAIVGLLNTLLKIPPKLFSTSDPSNDESRLPFPTPNSPPSSHLQGIPATATRFISLLFGAFLFFQLRSLYSFAITTPPRIGSAPLHIIIITFPRPRGTPESLLSSTIDSYLPQVSEDTTLSVFTAAKYHSIFQKTQAQYAHDQRIQWRSEPENKTNLRSNQYRHLGQALQWAMNKSEWTMIVEDDFPLCGSWGSNGLAAVIARLEEGRTANPNAPRWRSGFIGTGGSGLILHQSLLPIVSHLLFLHADPTPSLLPIVSAADMVIQNCLTGENPLCPKTGLVISSRLLMEHKGGMYSTYGGRRYPDDRWACGWRHPFHGRPETETIVV